MILDTHQALRVRSKAIVTVGTGDHKGEMNLSITTAGRPSLVIPLEADEGRVLALLLDRTQRDCR